MMRRGMKFWGIPFLILAVAWPSAWPSRLQAVEEKAPELSAGLAVALQTKAGGQTDHTVRPNFMLYVPAGEAASPFVAPGPFTAEWEGVIHLDLRDRFIFQAELNGRLKLEINGKPVLEETGAGGMTEPTKRISLAEFTTGIISISEPMIVGNASINRAFGVSIVSTGRIKSRAITARNSSPAVR